MTDTWLVTGGAGYIGAHVTGVLAAAGLRSVVVDDLSTGDASRVDDELVVGDCGDVALLSDVFSRHRVTGVIHLAAGKSVDESVARPVAYYRRNVAALVGLLQAMDDHGITQLVYSSSAAVYGDTDADIVSESDPTVPINPYGETKLIGEWLLRDQARAAGLRYAALRYFNVAGTSSRRLADTSVANLIPLALRAISSGVAPRIFGDDYPTPDGTCVRDFIHVADLAQAHLDAIQTLSGSAGGRVYNVGRGIGYSVREVVDEALRVTGSELKPEVAARRPGDPARVVADSSRLMTDTSWTPRHDLTAMVSSAWGSRT